MIPKHPFNRFNTYITPLVVPKRPAPKRLGHLGAGRFAHQSFRTLGSRYHKVKKLKAGTMPNRPTRTHI